MKDPDFGPYTLTERGKIIMEQKTLSRIHQVLVYRCLMGQPMEDYDIYIGGEYTWKTGPQNSFITGNTARSAGTRLARTLRSLATNA